METGVQPLRFHGHEKENLMKIKQAVCSIFLAIPMALLAQDAPAVIHLWTSGAPGFESRKDIPEAGTSAMLKSVDNPSLTVFCRQRKRPPARR